MFKLSALNQCFIESVFPLLKKCVLVQIIISSAFNQGIENIDSTFHQVEVLPRLEK